jgi:cellulose synthase/poly-beta-1,6-N-acetylglucosamine synthase-like glycosyltransferase
LLQQTVLVLLAAVLSILAIYATHIWVTTLYAVRRKRPPRVEPPSTWPSVSVHIPVYNENSVVTKLLDSVLAFDYPRDRLEIVLVDDSDDGTTEVLQKYEAKHPEVLRVIHRERREGFKAGALQTALTGTRSELITVFDADHVPSRDFLQRMVPYLASDGRVAFAQARPSYLPGKSSWIAGAVSMGTDVYALVELEARFSAGLLPHFGGSGAVLRRAALVGVGGWESDTLAEDLDLSIRLRLNGWQHIYDDTLQCPGEIPTSLQVLRLQQSRWASGIAGCLKKHFASLVRAEQLSLLRKLEALVYLTRYVASPLTAIAVVLGLLFFLVFPLDFVLLGFQTNAVAAFTALMLLLNCTAPLASFTVAAIRSTNRRTERARRLIDLISLGVLTVMIFMTSARATLDGFLDRATHFHKTPRRGDTGLR